MDEAYSESDLSFSPSQILERLQVLRQLQLMQRGKLQKHRLQLETPESSSSITEIVSHFSNSTNYNTFRSLLQSTSDISNEVSPRLNTSGLSQHVKDRDLIDGVSVLNLSQESEFVVNSPISYRSSQSSSSKGKETTKEHQKQVQSQTGDLSNSVTAPVQNSGMINSTQRFSVDEVPILSPRKDFEQMVAEKLKNENMKSKIEPKNIINDNQNKKPFLKKGEGIARFGIKKNTIVIQNTKSLPWKKKGFQKPSTQSILKQSIKITKNVVPEPEHTLQLQPLQSDFKVPNLTKKIMPERLIDKSDKEIQQQVKHSKEISESMSSDDCPNITHESATIMQKNKFKISQNIGLSKTKHPVVNNKGKTWAAVLTKEQNDFLRQLKQSEYYKNFASPTKSVISDVSCDETMCKLKQEREMAEQNLFDLLEKKVSHDSFNLENSFINRFLKKGNLECSGESTPLVLQKCLSNNPHLMHIIPGLKSKKHHEDVVSDAETCSNYTDCSSNSCSSDSCCSCKTVEQTINTEQNSSDYVEKKSTDQKRKKLKMNQKEVDNPKNLNVSMTEDVNKANIAEMNAKLIATSELLKDRLHELEDEIETFKKENANLAKLQAQFDLDRQKFYEDKAAFEQKINEEKVLNEYYLAEEKDKLSKQKQLYDRYVREMRGRLNKKDKDEVVLLKKEISDLKEEIRIKDAKSTSTIARLRNQIKIMEKEKKELLDEVEKLKKENRRIHHSNEVTRRLTNIKYLEEIHKKLNNMSSKDTRPEVHVDRDMKYKSYEIEKQCRSRKLEPVKQNMKPLKKAKSVPNLNVTSRYAKYFSQRDTSSELDQNNLATMERTNNVNSYLEDNGDMLSNKSLDYASSENDDFLEKMYVERFKSNSPKSNISSGSNSNIDSNFVDKSHLNDNANGFFIQKSTRNSKSPNGITPISNTNEINISRTKSPISILSYKSGITQSSNSVNYVSDHCNSNNSLRRSQSPLSAFNHSSLRSATVIHNNELGDKLMAVSPEPVVSKSSLTKTNLNPTELRKGDGSRELRFPNGNIKYLSADGKYSKFVYYNGDIKENFYDEGRIKYFYAETKTYHTTHADGLEVLEFPDGQVEKRYKDGSSEIRLPNGSVRYFDPKNKHIREEWRFPDGAALTVAANGDRRIVLTNGQVEVHAQDHKRREFPDGTVKLVYNDGTSETRYASGRIRIKDKHGQLIMDSAPG